MRREDAMSKLHEDEIDTDIPLVSRLLATQFPRWADLPLRPVEPAGTDNAIYRLGDSMAVRLPRIDWAVRQPVKEHAWLPRLARHLSLAIPEPLALGEPGEGYPWRWSICTWLPGEPASRDHLDDPGAAAIDLARFVHELEAIDAVDGPPPDGRGEPLDTRDEACRASIAEVGEGIDRTWAEAEWDAALAAPAWAGAAVWIHGDLDARNLLATRGRLSGVLDWGSLAVGDPAADVMVAWRLCDADARRRFRADLQVDDATWSRARGWVLSQAVMILSYYTPKTNAVLVTEAERWLSELLADPL
jgi:aminoglycoside phosphotransferase (APT) family kinase protein